MGVARIKRGDIHPSLLALGAGVAVDNQCAARQMQLESALIGVAIGASATDTLYDFGDRAGAVYTARANYDQYVATIEQNRLVAAVTLIEALGGGWYTSDLQ